MAQTFIGKPISLISHSDVRYKGTLAGIDPAASTIQLENVFSMGTETRRPPAQYIPPVPEPYAYIIFRASEVKDLSVDEQAPAPAPQHNVHDDPAVLGASSQVAPKPAYPTYASQVTVQQQAAYPPQQPAPVATTVVTQQTQVQPQATRGPQQQQQQQNASNRRPNPVHTAAASLETVERAMSDLRVNGSSGAPQGHHRGGGGGRRGRGGRGGGGAEAEQIKVPTTDFDFASSNAKFDKAGAVTPKDGGASAAGESSSGEGSSADKPESVPAYNPKASFFDSLSSSSAAPALGGGVAHEGHRGGGGGGGGRGRRGGGGGGGIGRNRREEEREKNVATFGEPGGVGLLGPGGYVGGWGGYGRRGGRPRRGGGGRGGGAGAQAAVARG